MTPKVPHVSFKQYGYRQPRNTVRKAYVQGGHRPMSQVVEGSKEIYRRSVRPMLRENWHWCLAAVMLALWAGLALATRVPSVPVTLSLTQACSAAGAAFQNHVSGHLPPGARVTPGMRDGVVLVEIHSPFHMVVDPIREVPCRFVRFNNSPTKPYVELTVWDTTRHKWDRASRGLIEVSYELTQYADDTVWVRHYQKGGAVLDIDSLRK